MNHPVMKHISSGFSDSILMKLKYVFGLIAIFFYGVSESNAGYLILKKCISAEKESCYSAVTEADPNSSKLYEILLQNEWPSSLAYPMSPEDESLLESERIKKALEKSGLDSQYKFVWLPDTLYELFLVTHFLESQERYFIQLEEGEDGKKHCSSLVNHDFRVFSKKTMESHMIGDVVFDEQKDLTHSTEYVEEFIAMHKDNLTQVPSEIRKRMIHLNELAKPVFLQANEALYQFLTTYVGTVDSVGKAEFKALRPILVQDFFRLFKSKKGNIFRFRGFFVRGPQQHGEPAIEDMELNSSESTLLDAVVHEEVEAYQRNDGLLYRGSNGFLDERGSEVVDHATHSLSYGGSIFAGIFRDSGINKSACAYQFMTKVKFPYLLPIRKHVSHHEANPLVTEDMFYLPVLGPIARLHSSMEYFHPRTKVQTSSGRIPGVEICPEELGKTGLLTSDKIAGPELTRLIDEFIGRNSIVLPKKEALP